MLFTFHSDLADTAPTDLCTTEALVAETTVNEGVVTKKLILPIMGQGFTCSVEYDHGSMLLLGDELAVTNGKRALTPAAAQSVCPPGSYAAQMNIKVGGQLIPILIKTCQ